MWRELMRLNAFTIERHALKIIQPIEDMVVVITAGADGED
jgi:hypothetical protein